MINNKIKILSSCKSPKLKLAWETGSYMRYTVSAFNMCKANYIGYSINNKNYLFIKPIYFNI